MLRKATIHAEVYVVGDDDRELLDAVRDAGEDVFLAENVTFEPVTDIRTVPDEWLNSVPWGYQPSSATVLKWLEKP